MKSNYVKYLLGCMSLALLTTTFNNANAFFTLNPTNWCYFNQNANFPTCNMIETSRTSVVFVPKQVENQSDYSTRETLNYYGLNNRSGRYYTNSTGTNISNGFLKSYNDGDYLVWRYKTSSTSTNYNSFMYNFIDLQLENNHYNFKWRNDTTREYEVLNFSAIPSLPNLNGNLDTFEYVVPWHGTWILYNAGFRDKLKTMQFIGSKQLENKIIYVDSLASSNNVWYIDINNMKARSYTENDIDTLSAFAFGQITSDSDLKQKPWDTYYDIVLYTGGISFLPQTYGNFAFSNAGTDVVYNKPGLKSSNGANIGLSYNKNFDFESPNFGDGSGDGNSSGNVINSYADYVACRDKYNNIRNRANSEYLCRSDMNKGLISTNYFTGLFHDIYTFSTGLENILAQTQNCQNWIDYSILAYYDSVLGNENLKSYQDNLLIADRNSRELNMLEVSNYCTYDITSGNGNGNSNDKYDSCWQCAWGLLGEDKCREVCTSGSGDSISVSIQKEVASWATGMILYPYNRLTISYNSGYDFIKNRFNAPSCINDYYGKHYMFVDLAIYILLISIVLFGILHL